MTNRLAMRRSSLQWRRTQPSVECLEGRRLLATSTIASTLDRNGNAIFAAIEPSGTIVVNQERPTNVATSPYLDSGDQILPGLTAGTGASLTATTLLNGDPVIYAQAAAIGNLFANEYVSTSDPANPARWSGWQQVGDFVSTSASAVTSATTSAVFAIGTDQQVYVASVIPATTTGTAATLGTFEKVATPFGAASLVAQGDGDGRFEVATLAGTHTYIAANRVTVGSDGTATGVGWEQLGTFVASAIDLTPGLNTTNVGTNLGDRLFLFAVGTDGNAYDSPLTANVTTGNRDSSTYNLIGSGDLVDVRATVSAGYLTVYELRQDGHLLGQQLVSNGPTSDPIRPLSAGGAPVLFDLGANGEFASFPGANLATAPAPDGGHFILASTSTGLVAIDHEYAHIATQADNTPIPDTFSGFTDLATHATHPIAASAGPGGGRVVVALGSDGTVDTSTASATTTTDPNPRFSDFTALPGLAATSIAAAQLDGAGEMAVYALTGASSLVYENQYLATGTATVPYAWTGWRPLGSFVATSIAAAYVAGASQATVFAVGTDGVVAALDRPASQTAPPAAVFTPLAGITAASIAVRGYDDSTIEVVAVFRDPAYAARAGEFTFVRFYQPSGVVAAASTSPPTGQWFFQGQYVAIQVAGGRNGKYAVAVSPFGYEAASAAYQPDDTYTNFVPLAFDAQAVRSGNDRSTGLVTLDSATSSVTVQLIAPTEINQTNEPSLGTNGVYAVSGGGTASSVRVVPPNTPTDSILIALGASTAALNPDYYVADTTGHVYASLINDAGGTIPPILSAYILVGALPT